MKDSLMRKALLAGALGCALLLSACNYYVDKTNKKIETVLERTEEYRQRSEIPDLPEAVDTVRMHNDIWLGNSSMKIMEGDPLPDELEQDDSITLAIAQDSTLSLLAQEITDLTGIEVRLDDLKAENAVPQEAVAVDYAGKLSGLLNYLSNRYGVWWRYKNGKITLFTKETRIFSIYALPTESKMSADLKGASMGGDIPDVGSSSLSTSVDLALWNSIEEGVKQVLGDQGKVVFSKTAGTATVTASPFVMQRVASYIANWNEKLSRQVAISVKVLQVQLENSDAYGLNLNAVFKSNNISTVFTGPSGAIAGDGALAGALSMTLLRPTSRWKGTQGIIQALSTQGKTSLVTSASVTTLNNKVAPVQITTSKNYVREVSVTNNYGSSTTSSDTDLDTDTLNYGFSMEILPRILDHGRLVLLFSMTLSNLLELERFTTGNQGTSNDSSSEDEGSTTTNDDGDNEVTTVQLPKMEMRGFLQEIMMTSGSTLVLTGFEKVTQNISTSGIGEAKVNLLGGTANNEATRDVMVILITPEVLESPMSPESRMRDF
ncbi:MAG: PilN family type IVB pilus formation outer membrane protein [Alphaproteobacteria bacterium]|nr:PilN family type IVB pilus formation outer membrane protein [Alphaproteobacteria bacterium]